MANLTPYLKDIVVARTAHREMLEARLAELRAAGDTVDRTEILEVRHALATEYSAVGRAVTGATETAIAELGRV